MRMRKETREIKNKVKEEKESNKYMRRKTKNKSLEGEYTHPPISTPCSCYQVCIYLRIHRKLILPPSLPLEMSLLMTIPHFPSNHNLMLLLYITHF